MKWEKVSRRYADAYRAWIDVFFEDPFARYSLFQIDVSGPAWNSFQPRTDQRASDLRKLSSGKPLTSYIAQAELCKSRLNSASYLFTGQFNM